MFPVNKPYEPIRMQPQMRFGWQAGFDLGTSTGATGKLRLYNDQWEKIGGTEKPETLLTSIHKNTDVIDAIAALISKLYRQSSRRLNGSDKDGKSLVFFVPGQQTNGIVKNLANLRRTDGEAVDTLDFNGIPSALKNNHIPLDKSVRLIVLNDMAGGLAAAIANIVQSHPGKIGPGSNILYVMTGGGLGAAEASYIEDQSQKAQIQIQLTELGHLPYKAGGRSLEDFGGAIPSLLRNFSEALPNGLKTPNGKPVASKNGRIVTEFSTAKKLSPSLTRIQHEKAAKEAVERYLEAISSIAAIKIYSGCNLLVIAGATANGIRRFCNSHPALYVDETNKCQALPFNNREKSVFEQLLLLKTWEKLTKAGQLLAESRHFDVIIDTRLKDNSEGTPYVAQGYFPGCNDKYVIPWDAFLSPATRS